MTYQIAIDVGGTFTDGVLLDVDTDTIWVGKVLTTPANPGDAIARLVEKLMAMRPAVTDAASADIERVVHGTTLITNTLLERKGAKTALVVTYGTEDTLDIRREMRFDTYDLAATFPEPLVPPQARFSLNERLNHVGEVRRALDPKELDALAKTLADEDVSAVAICFLHACVNGDHERAAVEKLRSVSPGRSYSISSEVAGEVGEYERMSTVVANAYVQPIVDHYLRELNRRLSSLGIAGRLDIMVSHGGFTEAEIAARFPIRLLESGPAGGVLSAINCAQAVGCDRILAFDMGGTTAKSCVSIGGAPAITHIFEFARVRRFKRGSGLPAVSPSIDLIEIGAGGGSIARQNALGLLQVGPESAGSEPGPACYGFGGDEPTVTDADLVLGYLDPDNFLGGTMTLQPDKAIDALGRLGKKIGRSAEEAAWGIHDIVNETMAAAARTHIAEHGHDARGFTFVSTGGAGPVHAVDVARRLRISRILCPIASGVGSCLGFLAAPARADQSWSRLEPVREFDLQEFSRREADARHSIISDLGRANVAPKDVRWKTVAEIRYLGQGASVTVDFDAATSADLSCEMLLSGFEQEYRRLYGRTVPEGIPEIVTWRISGQSKRQQRHFSFSERDASTLTTEPMGQRKIYLPGEKRYAVVPVYDRYRLPPAAVLAAPALIVEPESTLVIGHKAKVQVLANGTIQVDLEPLS